MLKFFSWLKSFFNKTEESYKDIYSLEERVVFSYFDGKETIHADPMVLYKRIMAEWGDLDTELKVAESPSKDANKMYNMALERLRKLFDLKTPSNPLQAVKEGCLQEGEVYNIFNRFIGFCNNLKKNSSSTQTSPEGTSSDTPNILRESPPIPNTSASGSTAKEPSIEERMKSPSVLG